MVANSYLGTLTGDSSPIGVALRLGGGCSIACRFVCSVDAIGCVRDDWKMCAASCDTSGQWQTLSVIVFEAV